MADDRWITWARIRKGGRILWTALSAVAVESVLLGVSVLPGVLLWEWVFRWDVFPPGLRIVVRSMALLPAYLVFAFGLTVWSALAMRVLGWLTPVNAEMRIADLEWPLLRWARYLVSAHVVRWFAGSVFRATPVWTFYHRLNGARMGRRVYINSLTVVDDNLLDFGEGVVIGSGVHLSGHTVERGVVKTAPVRLGANVTIGVGSVIGVGVEIGKGTEVGALSVVPKHRKLAAGAAYGGVPVRQLRITGEDRITGEERKGDVERANVLVVFYSRTGFTRAVAQDLARELNADLEELIDLKNRRGILGYLRSGFDAARHRLTELRPLSKHPEAYDLLVIGTPIWNASISSPVRTFLVHHTAALKVAFFCTYGGSGNERVFRQMEQVCGKAPLATMAIRDREMGGAMQAARIREFVNALQTATSPGAR